MGRKTARDALAAAEASGVRAARPTGAVEEEVVREGAPGDPAWRRTFVAAAHRRR